MKTLRERWLAAWCAHYDAEVEAGKITQRHMDASMAAMRAWDTGRIVARAQQVGVVPVIPGAIGISDPWNGPPTREDYTALGYAPPWDKTHEPSPAPAKETPQELIARWRARACTLDGEGKDTAAYHLRFAADELQEVLDAPAHRVQGG